MCADCSGDPLPPYLDGLRAVAHYDDPLRKAIHALKYEQLTAAAESLGRLLCDYLTLQPLAFDVIVPVPLHPERQAERGYNQSALLADVVAHERSARVDVRTLVRTRNTAPQVGLNESQRRSNLTGAFACRGRLEQARVLLIDDVCTTGATMRECAAALHAAGALSIWGLTLAR